MTFAFIAPMWESCVKVLKNSFGERFIMFVASLYFIFMDRIQQLP